MLVKSVMWLETKPYVVTTSRGALTLQQKASGGAGLEKGARLAVFLGSAGSDGITGKLISAIWDPWEELDRYKADLEDSDIYTLRRIIPSDRGLDW